MTLARTFPQGGIHPYERKEPTRDRDLWNAPIPSQAIVPLQQHIGAPAEAVVAPGDTVTEGMLIGKATGFVSARIHAPIPGTVKEIRRIYLPNGSPSDAVVIELEGEFEQLGRARERVDWSDKSGAQLLDMMKDAGIVGMGGATFPTHVKFSIPEGKRCEFLLLNGAECEPYLSADHRLMAERADGVVEGLRIAERILNPDRVFIGIEKNKPDAIDSMRQAVKSAGLPYTIVPLTVKYPQGDEKMLIKACTGREIPSGGLPLDIGAVAMSAGTSFATHEAVSLRKPVIERVVTVSGGAVRSPSNLKVRIGTAFGELFEECGGFSRTPVKIVSGGPMMGFTVHDLDTPVTKGTSGILALTPEEIHEAPETPCIRCGRCVRACPVGLSPTTLYKALDHEDYDTVASEGLMDCRECGSCSYVCPARIPLVQGFRIGKRILRKQKVKR